MTDLAVVERVSEFRKRAREAFLTFEHKEGSRLVHDKDLPAVIRATGVNPSNEQVSQVTEIIKSQLDDDAALVPYDVFQQAVVPWLLHNEKSLKRDNYHTIMRALRAFDPEGKGWIDSQVLKASLTTKGEMFQPDEAIKMVSDCADSKGRIWCEDFAALLQ